MQIEIPLPEHCCSYAAEYGSKPGWVWGPFWLLLTWEWVTAAIQAGP